MLKQEILKNRVSGVLHFLCKFLPILRQNKERKTALAYVPKIEANSHDIVPYFIWLRAKIKALRKGCVNKSDSWW